MVDWLGVFAVAILMAGIGLILSRYGVAHTLTLSDHVATGHAQILFRIYGLAYGLLFSWWLLSWDSLSSLQLGLLLTGVVSFEVGLFIPRTGNKIVPHDITANIAGSCLFVAIFLIALSHANESVTRILLAIVVFLSLIGASLLKRNSTYYLFRQLLFYTIAHIALFIAYF